ncbi:MAG: uroporphyrinogen-III C-methyltransferase [Pseudomonadota bacterium]
MESQSIETTDALGGKTVDPKPRPCNVAWSAIGLLCITWLCLFLGLTFFWQKNNNILAIYTTRLTQIQEQLSETQIHNQELQKNLSQLQDFIQKKFSANDTIARISNANRLIQLAHYNLVYLHDQDSALSALTLADKQLAELNNLPVSLEILRNLLAKNIASLKSLPHLDLSHLLAKLNSLQIQITQLPLLSTIPTHREVKTNPNLSHPEKKWLDVIQTILRSFQQVIAIRHLDKSIEPLLPQVQQQYLQHNLQLLLQQAQWALLHTQETVYQTSLQQTKEGVQQHFVESSPITQAVIQNIDELQQIKLQPTLPDLTPTLEAISSIAKTMLSTSRPN